MTEIITHRLERELAIEGVPRAYDIALKLSEQGWDRIDGISDLIRLTKQTDMQNELKHMGRSNWAEARHIIRNVYEDLNGLHTDLENVSPGWEIGTVMELTTAVGRLEALISYMFKNQKETPTQKDDING